MPIEATFSLTVRGPVVTTAPPYTLLGEAISAGLNSLAAIAYERTQVEQVLRGEKPRWDSVANAFPWAVSGDSVEVTERTSDPQHRLVVSISDFYELLTRYHHHWLDWRSADWRAGKKAATLLEFVAEAQVDTPRKLRLLSCACVQRVAASLIDQRSRRMLDHAEAFAEGRLGEETLRLVARDAEQVLTRWPLAQYASITWPTADRPEVRLPAALVQTLCYRLPAQMACMLGMTEGQRLPVALLRLPRCYWPPEPATSLPTLPRIDAILDRAGYTVAYLSAQYCAAWVPLHAYYMGLSQGGARATSAHERAEQEIAELVRDLFGDPFRPSLFDPSWLQWADGTVPRLAAGIYAQRRFDEMPILADALEEAGCMDAVILDHCRAPGEHVRGCWLLDKITRRDES